jgi:RND family efflux transporter MFP subunit
LEQEKIDVARATPVPDRPVASAAPRRGAPLWLQIILSLIVVAIAAGIAGLFLPSANTMLARVGVSLPLLTGTPVGAATTAPTSGAQAPGQTGQGQKQGGGQAGQGGQTGARQGGFSAANRVAVVVVVPATSGVINNHLTAIGDGTAVNSVTINTASSGTLISVNVKPGDTVTAGQKLAMLDSDTQQNAVDKAKLALADADSTLSRTQQLAKSNNVPTSQVDAAQLADQNAQLALQAAQIALDQRTIVTPVAGTVGIIQVSPGNLINAQSVVTTVEDSSSILVNFYVPERYSSQVSVGMAVAATSAALPGKNFSGKVTAIDNKIDPDSRTLQIQATIPNPNDVIKSGMSFSVDMQFPGETFPAVDPLSIQWSNQGAYVWKVADNKVHKGMVDIIQRNTDGVLVKGDVKPGDSIVTQGVLQLTDGAAIRLLDNGTAPAAGAPASAAVAPASAATAPSSPDGSASSAAGG